VTAGAEEEDPFAGIDDGDDNGTPSAAATAAAATLPPITQGFLGTVDTGAMKPAQPLGRAGSPPGRCHVAPAPQFSTLRVQGAVPICGWHGRSVFIEVDLGHARYYLICVSPRPNFPPENVSE